jgi:hypothetical protein
MTCAFYSIVYDIVFLIERKINYFIFIYFIKQPDRTVRQASVVHIIPALSQQRERVSRGKIREGEKRIVRAEGNK